MKQFFKLSEHKNDKNTAFAGSLHSGAWLGALSLLQSQLSAQDFTPAMQRMRSDIWFRQPVCSDFQVVSESVLQAAPEHLWQIKNYIEDDDGLKVEAVHQSCDQLPEWVLSPRLLSLQQLQPTLEKSDQQANALQRIQQKLQAEFAITTQLPLHQLQWCSTPSRESGLQFNLLGAVQAADWVSRLRLQVLLGYLAGWSFVSSLTSTTGVVDVLVSRVFAVAEQSVSQVELVSPFAMLHTPNSEAHFLQHLQTYRSARAEVLVRSGEVLMKGLFHVRYV